MKRTDWIRFATSEEKSFRYVLKWKSFMLCKAPHSLLSLPQQLVRFNSHQNLNMENFSVTWWEIITEMKIVKLLWGYSVEVWGCEWKRRQRSVKVSFQPNNLIDANLKNENKGKELILVIRYYFCKHKKDLKANIKQKSLIYFLLDLICTMLMKLCRVVARLLETHRIESQQFLPW